MNEINTFIEIISDVKEILKNNYSREDLLFVKFDENQEVKAVEQKEIQKVEIKEVEKKRDERKQLINELKEKFKECKNCVLCEKRKNVVFDRGNPETDILIITSPPDEIEEEKGIPFSGEDEELFKNMMKAINLDLEKIYITGIVKCHPAEQKILTEKEIFECMKILEQQISIIKPKYILLFGKTAAQYFLKEYKLGITQLRGQIKRIGNYYVIPTLHPKAIIKKPSEKRLVWEDLKKFRDLINGKLY